MAKNIYLKQDRVQAFITFMAGHLGEESELRHMYRLPNQDTVAFDNLSDALRKYDWPISNKVSGNVGNRLRSLADNTRVLNALRARLTAAVRAGDDDASCAVCKEIMKWGGVEKGNVDWLEENKDGLAMQLRTVSALLESEDDDVRRFPKDLRFNAGMTKVYSLLLDNFIIYDSRVAAALGWFVKRWMLENQVAGIPDELNFPCMPPNEGPRARHRKLRDAGGFKKLRYSQSDLHAQWNTRASWLLEASLAAAGSGNVFNKEPQPLRALEAALFMWGYDLHHNMPRLAA